MMRLLTTKPVSQQKTAQGVGSLSPPVQYFCISALLKLPTPYLSLSRIIKNAIDRASSSGRYLNFSSQRRRKILSTAASETERKRPDDAFFNDETVHDLSMGS